METEIVITSDQHAKIRTHLFSIDGKESIAFMLCGRSEYKGLHKLIVHEVHLIPNDQCLVRKTNMIKWSTECLQLILDKAAKYSMGIIKIHNHPKYCINFSKLDDISDRELFPSVYNWLDDFTHPHASAIMLPDGNILGRTVDFNGNFFDIKQIKIIGNDIIVLKKDEMTVSFKEFETRNLQVFGQYTLKILKDLKIAIVGCSGTGSPVIEALARLGVGKLLLVDFDIVEEKNLNRIINSKLQDAKAKLPKVEMHKKAIERIGLGTIVEAIQSDLMNHNTIKAISDCDVVFGCLDSIEGRHQLNKLCTFYLLPYFDLGVKLISDGMGGIESIAGNVHFLQPGLSTLLSRNVYTLKELRSESLKKNNPSEYRNHLKAKYIEGAAEDRPAVITVNMMCASIALNEFLGRIHFYRSEKNENYAITRFELVNWVMVTESEQQQSKENIFSKYIGRGDMIPPLNLPNINIL